MDINFNLRKFSGYIFIIICSYLVYNISISRCFSTDDWLLMSDPTYAYLLNGLNIAQLQGVGHTDHPGTILQIICGILLRIFYFFSFDAHSNGIVRSVLENPEFYLKNIYITIFILQSIIIAIVGFVVWYKFNNIFILFVIICGVFVRPELILQQSVCLRPEIIIPSLLMLLTMVTIISFHNNMLYPTYTSRNFAFWTGVLTCTSFFTKVTCIPIFAVSFFLIRDYKKIPYYLMGFFCISIICLPFIWNSLDRTVNWFISLVVHTGRYGSGDSSFISLSIFYKNIVTILNTNLLSIIILILTGLSLFFIRNKRNFFEWKISVLYILSVFLILFLVAKHYGAHYLIGIYMPIFFIPFIYLSLRKNIFIKTLSSLIYLIIILSSLYTIKLQHNNIQTNNSSIYELYYDSIIIESYNTYTLPYCLSFGNNFSGNRFSKELKSIYPHYFTYNIWNKQFYNFSDPVSFAQIKALEKKIFIRGSTLYSHDYGKELLLGKKILSPRGDNIYELLDVK